MVFNKLISTILTSVLYFSTICKYQSGILKLSPDETRIAFLLQASRIFLFNSSIKFPNPPLFLPSLKAQIEESDLLLFTGDIVNTNATEMHPWIDTFKKIKNHEFGKYSILGNHDYGEYVEWKSEELKNKNFEDIKDLHRQIDFKLLLNENTKLKKKFISL
jgi:predicted MPP superfamily phosphohydrolase